jgi:hypothetical protein
VLTSDAVVGLLLLKSATDGTSRRLQICLLLVDMGGGSSL